MAKKPIFSMFDEAEELTDAQKRAIGLAIESPEITPTSSVGAAVELESEVEEVVELVEAVTEISGGDGGSAEEVYQALAVEEAVLAPVVPENGSLEAAGEGSTGTAEAMPVVEETTVDTDGELKPAADAEKLGESQTSSAVENCEKKPKRQYNVERRKQAHFMLPESFIAQLQATADSEHGGNATKALIATVEKALKFKKWQKPESAGDTEKANRKPRKVDATTPV